MGKLVRDKIAEQPREGQKFITAVDDGFFNKYLMVKALEESAELAQAMLSDDRKAIEEELADVLEVLDTIRNLYGISQAHMRRIQANKHLNKGGFEGRHILV